MTIWNLMWNGVWLGFGAELSVALLWVGWHFAYRCIAPRVHPEHWLHFIHSIFTE